MKSVVKKKFPEDYKTALVTGGSSGIGAAMVKMLTEAGIKVFASSRNPQNQDSSPNIGWLKFDGASRAGIDSFIENHKSLLPKIDLLILNAGNGAFFDWKNGDAKTMRQQADLLVASILELSQAHLKSAQSDKPIAQVWVSSLASEFPLPFMTAYSGAKANISNIAANLMITENPNKLLLIDFRLGDYHTAFNSNLNKSKYRNSKMDRVWQKLEKHLREAPSPEKAAHDLKKALIAGKSRSLRSGSFFQAQLAPIAKRLLPDSWMNRFMKIYFGL